MSISAKQRAVLARGPANSVGREKLAKILADEKAPARKHVAAAEPKKEQTSAIIHAENVIREERARVKAILSARPFGDEQAEFLAYDSDISAEVAKGILSIH
jgi:hypothetical protein